MRLFSKDEKFDIKKIVFNVNIIAILIGAIMNTALDPIFIFAFDMGVKGAALATVISQICSSVPGVV